VVVTFDRTSSSILLDPEDDVEEVFVTFVTLVTVVVVFVIFVTVVLLNYDDPAPEALPFPELLPELFPEMF